MDFDYIISTDSTSDLPPETCDEKQIIIVNLLCILNGVSKINDYKESSYKAFYNAMREGSMPSTAHINVEECKDAWRPYLEDGKDIFYLSFSEKLSGSYQAACLAQQDLTEEYPERTIIVIDSRSTTWALGFLVLRCVAMREEGKSLNEVARWAEENRDGYGAFFTVNSLEYLKNGGRIGGVTALLGGMFQIQPILTLDEEGGLGFSEKVKGRKKAIRTIVEGTKEKFDFAFDNRYAIVHGDCEEDAMALKKQLEEALPTAQCYGVYYLGPVVASHVGPGTLSVLYPCTNRNSLS